MVIAEGTFTCSIPLETKDYGIIKKNKLKITTFSEDIGEEDTRNFEIDCEMCHKKVKFSSYYGHDLKMLKIKVILAVIAGLIMGFFLFLSDWPSIWINVLGLLMFLIAIVSTSQIKEIEKAFFKSSIWDSDHEIKSRHVSLPDKQPEPLLDLLEQSDNDQVMYCASCGNPSTREFRFCKICGNELNQDPSIDSSAMGKIVRLAEGIHLEIKKYGIRGHFGRECWESEFLLGYNDVFKFAELFPEGISFLSSDISRLFIENDITEIALGGCMTPIPNKFRTALEKIGFKGITIKENTSVIISSRTGKETDEMGQQFHISAESIQLSESK